MCGGVNNVAANAEQACFCAQECPCRAASLIWTELCQLLLACELEDAVIGVFTFLREKPLLSEMVFVLDSQYQLAHVPIVRAGQLGRLETFSVVIQCLR